MHAKLKLQKGDDFMENKILIDKAIEFIQENPKENLSLECIADHAGFSLTYFDALFKDHTGYTPVEYSRVYKLTRSALELRRTDKTILDIALDYGYSSPESFARAFKNFYSIAPSDYREKHLKSVINWHDLSGKIAINHFKRNYPELKVSDIDSALDFCFTHNPLKYAEDVIGMTVAETEVLTIGDPDELSHFVYVSDYNSVDPAVTLVCENEGDALKYLKLLSRISNPRFSIHRSVDEEWEDFNAEVAKLGLTCRYGFDMIYPYNKITVPEHEDMSVRMLNIDDMSKIKAFKHIGGCADCHVRAIQICLEGKGNVGMMPIGVFVNDDLVCLAMPTLDCVRELKKYDIGAIFAIENGKQADAVELIWKFVIDTCLKENAAVGNGNAREDDSPLGVKMCEHIGLVKIAKNCAYSK